MTAGRHAALCMVLALTIPGGCALFTAPRAEPDKEVLIAIPTDLAARPRRDLSLLVLTPEAGTIHDTALMAYVDRPGRIAYFSRSEWAARPPQMLRALLVRTLDRSRYVAAVVTPPFAGRISCALRTEIMAFEQDFTTDPPTFHLTLRVSLIPAGAGAVVVTHEVELREPLAERTPQGGAAAANAATAKALKEVAEFVHAHAS